MKARLGVRLVTLVAAMVALGMAAGNAQAQSFTLSPNKLTFGVPTGQTTSVRTLDFSMSGSGTVTIYAVSIVPTGEFSQTNNCVPPGNFSVPATCTVTVTFTPTTAGLKTASLHISVTGHDDFVAPLSGASGAIRLLDPVNVALSNSNATLENLITFNSTSATLSCPGTGDDSAVTGVLSSTPDGLGNVFVDNFLTLTIGANPVIQTKTSTLQGNVCSANRDNPNDNGQPDCFTHDYQNHAGGTIGQDVDSITGPGATLLPDHGSGGIAPIDVSTQLSQLAGATGQVTFSMLDGGGEVGSSTLFLVTNCTPQNVQTGTQTGNPINTANNQNAAQTLTFDSVLNHLDQFAFDYSFAGAAQTIAANPNATPIVNNNSISPDLFSSLVAGTPFAGASCLPLASLNGMCAGKQQICTNPGNANPAGPNCPQSSAPNLFFSTTFDPQTLVTNPSTIFGFLEFNDSGTCTNGFEGPEAGKSCPQNQIVSFAGPGEYKSAKGAKSTNSTSVVVTGVNPPTTGVTVSPFFATGPTSGWTNGTPSANFQGNPGASGSFVAPIDLIEFGVNANTAGLPPTFPLPFPGNASFSADTILSNVACPNTATNPYTSSAPVFTPPSQSLGPFADGSSQLLHYATTDCAGTHELNFMFANSVWSTSFKSLTLMVDTLSPTVNFVTPPATGGSYKANQKVPAAFNCTDTESGVTQAHCVGTTAPGSNIDTKPTDGLTTLKSFTVTGTDNVGNANTSTVNYTVNCNYASVGLSPSTVKRPGIILITTSVTDCKTAPQTVSVKFTLSGPLGKNCSPGSSVMFTTPQFTIKSGTSSSISFPFPIAKAACAGNYTVTTTTLQGGLTIDTVSSTLTVN